MENKNILNEDQLENVAGGAFSYTYFCFINQNLCTACGSCFTVCPIDAIKFDVSGRPEIDIKTCNGCKQCADVCPKDAVMSKEITG